MQDHVYTVLGAVEIDGEKLYRVRNPWGREYYNGSWSDDSNVWSASLQQKLDYLDEDDGIFFIDYLTLHKEMIST